MNVGLLYATPLDVIPRAGAVCIGADVKAGVDPVDYALLLIDRGHESVLEHVVFTFQISGISRALLQELARHRHISLSVESTRYCLKKIDRTSPIVPEENVLGLEDLLRTYLQDLDVFIRTSGVNNDTLKYYLPECAPTNLIMTCNLRELRHIYHLRSSHVALPEFQCLVKRLAQVSGIDRRLITNVADTAH